MTEAPAAAQTGAAAGAERIFVSYIDKSRDFYRAQGYETPYRWAHFDDTPFTPLARPLAESRVGLITTTTLIEGDEEPDPEDRPPKAVFAAPMQPPPERMYTQDLSWDKDATHTDDLDSYLPIRQLDELRDAGRIGSLSPRFYGVPTEYSQRRTIERDAPEVLARCREDGVEVALLVPI